MEKRQMIKQLPSLRIECTWCGGRRGILIFFLAFIGFTETWRYQYFSQFFTFLTWANLSVWHWQDSNLFSCENCVLAVTNLKCDEINSICCKRMPGLLCNLKIDVANQNLHLLQEQSQLATVPIVFTTLTTAVDILLSISIQSMYQDYRLIGCCWKLECLLFCYETWSPAWDCATVSGSSCLELLEIVCCLSNFLPSPIPRAFRFRESAWLLTSPINILSSGEDGNFLSSRLFL